MTVISASLSLLWLAGFWLLTRDRVGTIRLTLAGLAACMVAVCIAASDVQAAALAGYPSDSFWTLSWAGRAGVVAISTIGIAFIFLALAWKTKLILRIKTQISATAWFLFDLAAGWAIFGVIHTVSPQAFYTFYRLIFDALPNQWVIDTFFDSDRLQLIASLPANGSLADHLAGIALWAIIPFTTWLHLRHWWRG